MDVCFVVLDEVIEMVIVKYNVVEYGFNFWIINDVFFDM